MNNELTKKTLKVFFAISLFAMAATVPFGAFIYHKVALTLVATAVLYAAIFQKKAALSQFFETYKDLLMLLAILIFAMFLSSFFSPVSSQKSFDATIRVIFVYFLPFLSLLFLYQDKFFGKKEINFVIVFLLLGLFAELVSGIVQIFFHNPFFEKYAGNTNSGLTGTTINRNIFGFYMAYGAVLMIILFIRENRKNLAKVFYLILLALFFIGLLFSYSRTSWVFVAVFCVAYTVLFFKKLTKQDFGFLVFIMSLFAVPILFSHALSGRFLQLVSGDGSGRLEIWNATLSMISERLLFGYGADTFLLKTEMIWFPHNFILEILYSLGFVGFFVSFALLYVALKEIIKTKTFLFLPLFLAFFAAFQFDHSLNNQVTLAVLSLFAFFIFKKRADKKSKTDQSMIKSK